MIINIKIWPLYSVDALTDRILNTWNFCQLKHPLKNLNLDKSLLILFGQNIKNAREEKGISQEELATLIDSSRSFVSSIELGKTNPSLLTVLKLCKVLDIQNLNFLLGK